MNDIEQAIDNFIAIQIARHPYKEKTYYIAQTDEFKIFIKGNEMDIKKFIVEVDDASKEIFETYINEKMVSNVTFSYLGIDKNLNLPIFKFLKFETKQKNRSDE